MEPQQPNDDRRLLDELKVQQQQQTSKTNDVSNISMPIKSKIIESDQEKKVAISNLNFSFELLQIRTKEFREKVWSNNVIYFVLLVLFIIILILNVHHTTSTLRFFSLILSSILNSLKFNVISNRFTRNSSERIRLSDVLKSSSSSSKRKSRPDKRYGGFNRLPQNEEESDLVIVTDDDDDDDDSDVLEDFSRSQQQKNNNSNNHVI